MQRVLVVEDDPGLRFVVGEALRDGHFDVVEMPNAEEALKYLRCEDHIDLVFSDINMPGMLGFSAKSCKKSR